MHAFPGNEQNSLDFQTLLGSRTIGNTRLFFTEYKNFIFQPAGVPIESDLAQEMDMDSSPLCTSPSTASNCGPDESFHLPCDPIEMTENKPPKYFQPKEWNTEKLMFNYDALWHLTSIDKKYYETLIKLLKMGLRRVYFDYKVPENQWVLEGKYLEEKR